MRGRIKEKLRQAKMYWTIRRSGLFDREYYLRNNLDVARSCMDPIKHYIKHGWREGRDPNKHFITEKYLQGAAKSESATQGSPLICQIANDLCKQTLLNQSNGTNIYELPLSLLTNKNSELGPHYRDKRVAIIIPIYNALNYLEPLLKSIYCNSDVHFSIIAVDDKSTDARIQLLLEKYAGMYSNFQHIKNDVNLGFVKSANSGIAVAPQDEDIVVLNSDTEVPNKWLSRLFHPIWSRSNIGSSTPMSNSATIMSFPALENNPLFGKLSLSEIDKIFQVLDPTRDIYIETPTGHGFCMAMSRQAINQIGLFDENAFGRGYGEENDWSQRAKANGFRNVIAPNLYVYHKESASFGDDIKNRRVKENMQIINRRYPNYMTQVHDTLADTKYLSIRKFLLLLTCIKDASTTVLRIENDLKGGSHSVSQDQINSEYTTAHILVRCIPSKKAFRLELIYKEYRAAFDLRTLEDLKVLSRYMSFDKIVVNQLVGYNLQEILPIIVHLKNCFQIPLEYLVHDFFSLCPDYNLMYQQKQFCPSKDNPNCADCYSSNDVIKAFCGECSDISQWREMWRTFLAQVDNIVVFSDFTKKTFSGTYPEFTCKIILKEISVSYLRPANPRTSKHKTIAVIGGINYQKGSGVIWEMYKLTQNEPQYKHLSILLFGETDNPNLRQSSAFKGPYKRNKLPELMEKHQVDIIFVPSIWGETFCITAQEAIHMNMPLAVFNIGAPPERTNTYSKGLVINHLDPIQAINAIDNFIQD